MTRFEPQSDASDLKRWLRHRWGLYADHRSRVVELLYSLGQVRPGRAAILGAGACIDIDLHRLLNAYDRITLVDIEEDFLDDATWLQPDVDWEKVDVLQGLDVTGMHHVFESELFDPAHEPAIARLLDRVDAFSLTSYLGNFHTVCSDCVLSQLIMQIVAVLGETHPRILEVIQHVRRRHLEILLEHTRPGGCAVLISDLVSSMTAPQLLHTPPVNPAEQFDELIRAHNFFTGCNPYAIVEQLESDAIITRQHIEEITLTQPWLWHVDNDKVQLVYGLIMAKSANHR